MDTRNILRIGDVSDNGQVTIIDEDRLCYLVRSESRGSVGLRTISKTLLDEYIAYFSEHPNANANLARDVLSGKSDVDKFEYGYTSTLTVMANMVIKGTKNKSIVASKKNRIINIEGKIAYFRPYATAIKSKPFLLLAGISGTGKSRIVRELARACWDEGSEEYKVQKPKNFEIVQVKPNWHDSSELIGYVSRIGVDKDGNPRPVFVM